MAKIQDYNPQTEASGPFQTRQADSSDTGGIGAGYQSLGNSLEYAGRAIEKYQAQSEISDLSSKLSQLHADQTQALDDHLQKADPSNPNLTEEFMDKFDDQMSQIGQNISTARGQNYFQKASATLRQHFQIAAIQGASVLAGEKAKTDYTNTLNNFSSALISDPSSFDATMKLHDDAIQEMVSNGSLRSKNAIELQQKGHEELAKSAVRGWINLNPQMAQRNLQQGQWDKYFSGDTKYQMLGEAERGIRAQDIDQQRAQKAQQDALAQQQTTTQNQFLSRIQNGSLSAKDILNSNLDPVGSGSKEQFLQMLDKHTTEKIKTDPNVFTHLFTQINLPDGDPHKITDENVLNGYLGKGLTLDNLRQLRQEIQGKKTEAGENEAQLKKGVIEIAKSSLTKSNPMTGMKDPNGDTNFQRWMSDFLDQYPKQRQAGKSAHALLDPDSPDYLGKSIRTYQRTQQQIVQDMVTSMRDQSGNPGATPPPVPPKGQPPEAPGQSRTRVYRGKTYKYNPSKGPSTDQNAWEEVK